MTIFLASVRADRHVRGLFSRLAKFVRDDDGQDLIEYAFLAAFIGVAGWAVLSVIDEAVASTYSSYLDPVSGVPALWEPAEPVGSSP